MHSTLNLSGQLVVGQRRIAGSAGAFHAVNPATGEILAPAFSAAAAAQVDLAASLAQEAFDSYRETSGEQRANFLEKIADGIEALGATLLERTLAETALPLARLQGERARTTGQLRMFAEVARSGLWQTPALDRELPERQPGRRPDLRTRLIPLGPVAVFGASNFPLAFSVAGGDTAAALAAGCPVIVKAHPSHPGTSEVVAAVIQAAAKDCGLPEGVFSMVAGPANEVGQRLVSHPALQAVAFTGSRAGGLALCRLAQQRAQPIPVYAEMSAINPVFVLPHALANRAGAIATGFVDSLLLGGGQFCTNPGVVLGIGGPQWDTFCAAVVAEVGQRPAATLLNAGMQQAYRAGLARLAGVTGVERVAQGQWSEGACAVQASVFLVDADSFMAQPTLHDEVFGPCSLLVRCRDLQQMRAVAEQLEGQLTATLQLDPADVAAARQLLPVLERKAGRLLINGFPTGVEVAHAMVHGGPFPATSDARGTSVGSRAIERFLRPVCYQDFPTELLPMALNDVNPLAFWRVRDGQIDHVTSPA